MLANILNILNLVVMFVLLVGGAVLMGMRRGEHGRAAVAGIVGCVVLLLAVIVSAALAFLAPTLVESLGIGGYQPVFMLVNAASMILQAVGTGLLIWAVVARRNPPQQARPGQGRGRRSRSGSTGSPSGSPGPSSPDPSSPGRSSLGRSSLGRSSSRLDGRRRRSRPSARGRVRAEPGAGTPPR
ncbi:hypothetical protein ACFQQB_08195 [Nonomuraea rubra]|uniref:hypothetical protein n=1 Tax=Nonomuraea rubra TaxID=46180 RepID=UPI00360F5B76